MKKTIQIKAKEFAIRHAPTYSFFEDQVNEHGQDPIVLIREFMEFAYVNAHYNGRADLRKELRAGSTFIKDRRVRRVLKYCQPHLSFMWAANVVALILDCDFKDAKIALARSL